MDPEGVQDPGGPRKEGFRVGVQITTIFDSQGIVDLDVEGQKLLLPNLLRNGPEGIGIKCAQLGMAPDKLLVQRALVADPESACRALIERGSWIPVAGQNLIVGRINENPIP